jgi:hypothetical protein
MTSGKQVLCGGKILSEVLQQVLQETVAAKDAELAAAREGRDASDADWEARMQAAVDSAERWKELAEKLGADKGSADAALAAERAQLQARAAS